VDNAEQQLIEKLRRIEALFSRPGTEGERVAAARARDRILEKLRQTAPRRAAPGEPLRRRPEEPLRRPPEEPLVEHRFSLTDPWSRRLLLALLRHHDIAPYRRRGQHRNTITARAPKSFIDEVLWPQFREFERELREYFDQSADRIIAAALSATPPGKGKPR